MNGTTFASTTSKILESQKQWNSFKAIKDIVMIIPSFSIILFEACILVAKIIHFAKL